MTQQNENQFDDLTVGSDADGSFSTDSIDLFEFSGGEESPIARLKTIILSIDWEINDDILQQLDDELVDLGEIWAQDKIKQVYIQGLHKIGKYIFKEKANAHPNSIKLLLTFYHNLEQIVSSADMMSEEEKKNLLLNDVKKFDQLKAQIGQTAAAEPAPAAPVTKSNADNERLGDLKALVLGLDWEITDQGLQKLQEEVKRLESVFHEDKAKRILLQGIGAVTAYINKMRSQSNSKSFSLLHSFCDALETITLTGVSAEQEKKLLLTEVEKFNAFKKEIAATPTQETSEISAPAKVAEVSKDPASKGFAASLPADVSADEEQVADDVSERLASVFGGIDEPDVADATDKDAALEGVNIETEADDDSDEDALPFENGAVAPALADVDEESSFSVEKLAGDLAGPKEEEEPVVTSDADDVDEPDDVDAALKGIDVESDADDESDEEALPFEGGEVAPALSGSFDDDTKVADEEVPSEDLDNRLDSFFDDEVESSLNKWGVEEESETDAEPSIEEGDTVIAALSDEPADASESEEDVFSSDGEGDDLIAALSDESFDESESVEDIFSSDGEGDDLIAALSDDSADTSESEEDVFSSDGEGDDLIAALSDESADDSESVKEVFSSDGEGDDLIAALSVESADDSESMEDVFSRDDEDADLVPALSDESSDDSESEDDVFSSDGEDDSLAAALSDEPVSDSEPIEETLFSGEEDEVLIDESVTEIEEVEEQASPTETSVEDDVEEQLSIFDDDEPSSESNMVAALSPDEDSLAQNDDVDEDSVFLETPEESVFEESTDTETLFAGDNESDPHEDISGEEDVQEELAASNEETLDDTAPLVAEDVSFSEAVDDSLVAEESEDSSTDEEESESITFLEEDAGDLVEPEVLTPDFTDDGVEADTDDVDELFDSEEIEFTIPGESDVPVSAVNAPEVEETGEVVFEVVADDVAVDMLPGEHYSDGDEESMDEDSAGMGAVSSTPVLDPDLYTDLENGVFSYRETSSPEDLNSLLIEINTLRSSASSDFTAKIYLQLLSTVCQMSETGITTAGDEYLVCMGEIVAGLKSAAFENEGFEHGQEQILRCTSQVLLLQQGEIQAVQSMDQGNDSNATVVDEEEFSPKEEKVTVSADESLKSFVQDELADIRKIFLDEISSLRKEFRD